MARSSFKISLVGDSPLLESIRRILPDSPDVQVTMVEIAGVDRLESPAADLILFIPAQPRIPAWSALAARWKPAVPCAFAAAGLPTRAAVSLLRAGFTEVFDPDTEMDLIQEWILDHYEAFLQTRQSAAGGSFPRKTTLIGSGPGMADIRRLAEQAAQFSDLTVLIQGETGTGKEMVARMIHEHSDRSGGPFVEVNCSAIPETLMEAEMLGNEKGAFTGAGHNRKGFFEIAAGGTLFLDEIGVMSPAMQNKLLKIVEEKRFRRIGGEKTISVDVKIIAGTNTDLDAAVRNGTFRPDLLYRLKVFTIHLPPLRDRTTDIPELAAFFMAEMSRRYALKISGFHPGSLALMDAYDWPGNVRELKHVVERACVLAGRGRIMPGHLPGEFQSLEPGFPSSEAADETDVLAIPLLSSGMTLDEMERLIVREVVKRCNDNQSEAARRLGISRTRLARKLMK